MDRETLEKLDVTSLGDMPGTDQESKPVADDAGTCDACGGDMTMNESMESICGSCGCVAMEKTVDTRDRAAYDAEQYKNRSSRSPVSYLSPNKNLGSHIGYGKYSANANRLRKIKKFSEDSEEREMKDFLRDVTFIADSRMMGLTRREVEDLVIAYRKKFLGKKISIGRSRFIVNLAFSFLEMRLMKDREYLSIDEFIDKVNQSASKGKMTASSDRSKTGNLDDKKNFRERLTSSIKMFVKEHGYRLSQPSLDSIIQHVVMTMDVKAPVAIIARDSMRAGKMVLSYYKGKGIKYAGLAGALIKLACLKNDVNVRTTSIVGNIYGVTSPITIKERIDEVKKILAFHCKKIRESLSAGTASDRVTSNLQADLELAEALIESSC
jgi:transcription initiation factor TFIIIB Brf1 subunit/transcription initiation factor TFIIB